MKIAVCPDFVFSSSNELSELNNFGIDWNLNPYRLPLLKDEISYLLDTIKIKRGDLEIRFCCSDLKVDIFHSDEKIANMSLSILKSCIDYIGKLGGGYFTIKPQLFSGTFWDYAVKNLKELVECGNANGVIVCIENTSDGILSNPKRFRELLEKTGAMATVDIFIDEESSRSLNFLKTVSDKIVNVHLRGGVSCQNNLDTVLDALLNTDCAWLSVDISEIDESKPARELLSCFLKEKGCV